MKSIMITIISVGLFCSYCYATSKTTTTTYPDGRIVVEEEFKGVRGSDSTLAIVVVSFAVLGGIGISFLGIRTIVRAMKLGATLEASDVEVDFAKKSLKMKKVSQGVIICLFGAAVIVMSVQQLSSLIEKDSAPSGTGLPAPPKFEAGAR